MRSLLILALLATAAHAEDREDREDIDWLSPPLSPALDYEIYMSPELRAASGPVIGTVRTPDGRELLMVEWASCSPKGGCIIHD